MIGPLSLSHTLYTHTRNADHPSVQSINFFFFFLCSLPNLIFPIPHVFAFAAAALGADLTG